MWVLQETSSVSLSVRYVHIVILVDEGEPRMCLSCVDHGWRTVSASNPRTHVADC